MCVVCGLYKDCKLTKEEAIGAYCEMSQTDLDEKEREHVVDEALKLAFDLTDEDVEETKE